MNKHTILAGVDMPEEPKDYSKDYSEQSFWDKLKKYALAAGKEVISKALVLYYVFNDKDTPAWAKAIILASLGYFISPLDAIPDMTPIVGYADDLGALIAALTAVAANIKKQHSDRAHDKLHEWFRE